MTLVLWDDDDDLRGNVQHIARHGLTPEDVDAVLLDPDNETAFSRSSGLPVTFGLTPDGRYIIVVWRLANADDPRIIYPVTAYEVPPPAS